MTTLRVYIDHLFDIHSAQEYEWALFDARGEYVREGKSLATAFPAATLKEAVLSVTEAPIIFLPLPPMSGNRLEGAARLALEDRLIVPVETLLIAAQPVKTGGVLARWLEKSTVETLKKAGFTRAISEADLIEPAANAWQCGVSDRGQGFVRRDDGSAFAITMTDHAPPAELDLALKRADPKPQAVVIHADRAAVSPALWQKINPSIAWRQGQTWRRWRVPSARFAQAADLFPAEKKEKSRVALGKNPFWRYALLAAVAALLLHGIATFAAWGYAHFSRWQTARGFAALAKEAGVAAGGSVVATQKALARAHGERRHKAGLYAPDDALFLLAQMATTLSSFPPARNARFSDGAWTFEWNQLPADQQKTLEAQLRGEGLSAVGGVNQNIYRLRVERAVIAF